MDTGSTPAQSRAVCDERSTQIEERYRGLVRQIPLLYVVAASSIVGLSLSTSGPFDTLAGPAGILIVIMAWRFIYWIRARGRPIEAAEAQAQIKNMRIFAVIVAVGFSVWSQYLISTFPDSSIEIVFFTSLSAIGCAFALSSDPKAASAPLFLLGLPLAARLLSLGSGAELGMGVSLLLVILLTYRLVRVQNRTVADLVSSRLRLEIERNRARDAECSAQQQALTDPLTGIANRRALIRALEGHVSQEVGDVAIASIDLDGFKPINDVFGHAVGDTALSCIATRLVEQFGRESLVARVGGDEFAVLWLGQGAWLKASRATPRLLKTINEPILVAARTLRMAGCVGVARGDGPGYDASVLLDQADTALYHAKSKGSGRSEIFSDELLNGKQRLIAIENALRDGTLVSEMVLVYQPIQMAHSGDLIAFEALARWASPALGDVGPGEFIPVAEQINMISPLTERSLELAIRCAGDWPSHISLSFNVSAVYLCAEEAAGKILSTLRKARFPAERMQLEVTETAVLTEFEVPRKNLAVLREAGACIALDDFGAGNASISYLREMNFDAVKFDGSLIVDIARDPRRQKLLKGLVQLCQSLGTSSTAEHVSSIEDLAQVQASGCDNVQGFLVGRPVSQNAHVLRNPALRGMGLGEKRAFVPT